MAARCSSLQRRAVGERRTRWCMSLRSGKNYQRQKVPTAETERAASENAGEGSVTVAELLTLLMEERKLRAQEEQRGADREQIKREAERKRREEEERRHSEQDRLARDEWRLP